MRTKKATDRKQREVIEEGDTVFTVSADTEDPGRKQTASLPLPFRVAARTCLLARADEPELAVLGWGLGAMGGEMAKLRPEARILGVELCSDLAKRAQQHLPSGAQLLEADALAFLERTRRRFDLLLDDCFAWKFGFPERPPELLEHGDLASRRLRPRGIYVRNMLPEPHAPLERQTRDLRMAFGHVELRRFREWDNVLALCSQEPLHTDWRSLLR